MGFIENLAGGFTVALSASNLFYCALGALLGTAIGVLPGLGPPATIALLLPVTFKMEPVSAVIMLAGIFYGAMYGGSTTSILLNIPGEAASVITCLDGYKMARNGRAGAALGMSALGSFIAGDSELGAKCRARPDHPFYRQAHFPAAGEIAALCAEAGFGTPSFMQPSAAGGLTFFSVS